MLELTLAAALVMSALLVSVAWLTLKWQRSSLIAEVRRSALFASDAVENGLRMGMMRNDREEVRASVERITQRTRIEDIRIIEHRGAVTLSARGEDSNRRVDVHAPSCAICHGPAQGAVTAVPGRGKTRTLVEGGRVRSFTPVLAGPGCITTACHHQDVKSGVLGVIDVSLTLDDVESDLALLRIKVVAVSLATVVAGSLLIWLALARRFRSPMSDLLGGIRRVAAGDLGYRVSERSPDEFGELARSFNSMSRQLSATQQSLIQSERLISMGKLAAGVAHEINNPLTGILSYAEDLAQGVEPEDPRRADYEVIVHEALRCRQIVRNLLDFARQDTGAPTLVLPQDILVKALNVIVRQAAFRNIVFERQVEPDLPPIHADPVQIEQVLINLVVNAQEAMPAGGKIVVGARLTDDRGHVEFYVEDEGLGIPPEIRHRIFEPFFSTKGGKTDGLGLAVCLGIVQQHRGRLAFESKAGNGTVFRVRLPACGRPVPRKEESTANG